MYGLIWRILPGPWASKFIMAVGLLAGGAALLWFFAFPALSPHMPFNDGAVDTSSFGGQDPAEGTDPTGGEAEPAEGEAPGMDGEPGAEGAAEPGEGI